ncbi:MAG: hypothetical protein AB1750_14345 [Chloroflexota bacterium]
MSDSPIKQPVEPTVQDNTPIAVPTLEEAFPEPAKKADNFDRALWYTIGGIVLISCCGLLLIGYLFTKSDIFKDMTTIFEPFATYTPAPTPDMPATQQAWVKPAQSPTLGSSDEAQRSIDADGTLYLPGFSRYASPHPEVEQPGEVYFYSIDLNASFPMIWSYGWCTLTAEILDQNFAQMKVEFILNGRPVSSRYIASYDHKPQEDRYCRTYAILVTEWPAGMHKLDSNVTFLKPTDDGWNVYPAGMHTFRYFVNVQP